MVGILLSELAGSGGDLNAAQTFDGMVGWLKTGL